jgi:hypothetical protein
MSRDIRRTLMVSGKWSHIPVVSLLAAVCCVAVSLGTSAAVADPLVYKTGFERPEIMPGHLNGQDGWLNPSKTVLVNPAQPATGKQSVLILGSKLKPLSTPGLLVAIPGRLFFYDASGQTLGVGVDVKLEGPLTPREDLVSANLILKLADDEFQPVYLGEAWLSSAGYVFVADSTGTLVGWQQVSNMETYHRLGAVVEFSSPTGPIGVTWYVDGGQLASFEEKAITASIFAVANPAMLAVDDRAVVKPNKYRSYFDNYCVVSEDAESCAMGP